MHSTIKFGLGMAGVLLVAGLPLAGNAQINKQHVDAAPKE